MKFTIEWQDAATTPPDEGSILIRPFRESDNIQEITRLLHRAYKPLADEGMQFVASHQTDATTSERIHRGQTLIAEYRGEIVGTITYYSRVGKSNARQGLAYYERSDVAEFGQFAVAPELQRSGLGSRLIEEVEKLAIAEGMTELSLNTAENATALREFYARRGYTFLQYAQWETVNYRSVLMSKVLTRRK